MTQDLRFCSDTIGRRRGVLPGSTVRKSCCPVLRGCRKGRNATVSKRAVSKKVSLDFGHGGASKHDTAVRKDYCSPGRETEQNCTIREASRVRASYAEQTRPNTLTLGKAMPSPRDFLGAADLLPRVFPSRVRHHTQRSGMFCHFWKRNAARAPHESWSPDSEQLQLLERARARVI